MKKVITYGTFDMLHHGHLNLLMRAKALGDYLIVGVTTENYDRARGKLNVQKSCVERVTDIYNTGLADKIIIEEYEGQKIDDIQRYEVDIFAIGSDWKGKFDYLKEYCEVVYIERTKGISSTQIRNESRRLINLGIIGSGRIAHRFVPESKYVSGINVAGVFNPNLSSAKRFCEVHELNFYTDKISEFYKKVDAVYIASPHQTHGGYIKDALENNLHVLCEKPMTLNSQEARELYTLAHNKNLILMEGIKTAYAPAFQQLLALVKSGAIGVVKDIDASFTKLVNIESRELSDTNAGGSITELASYTLLPIIKIFGIDYKDVQFYSFKKNNIDHFTRGFIQYNSGIASFKVGLGVKTEGELVISGTKGYAYVPAPWWKTEYFELRYEDLNKTMKFFNKFEGDGLRYEISEFLSYINRNKGNSHKLNCKESTAIISIIEKFTQGFGIKIIN